MQRRTPTRLGIAVSIAMLSTVVAAPTGFAANAPLEVPEEAAGAVADARNDQYIVLLEDDPVTAYEGDVRGMAATAPDEGEKVDVESRDAQRYATFLTDEMDDTLERAGAERSDLVERFTTVLNGFAAELDEAEVQGLQKQPNVLAVVPNEVRELTTDTTPDFLGLTSEGTGADAGLWAERGQFGEDVVIGVLDSGLWPENPSFADNDYGALAGWVPECETGQAFDADDCSDKVLTAQFYPEGFFGTDVAQEDVLAAFPEEYFSPRDADGHGSHTASTAGGNAGVETPYGGISGIAPRARLAIYKTCWGYSGEGGCATVDNVAAIEDAVEDGVDVINYSISGTSTQFLDPVEIAFLFASQAGVVVNASAGNSGPTESTVAHPSPWITTVAAGTESATLKGTVTVGATPGETTATNDSSAPMNGNLDRRAEEYDSSASCVADDGVMTLDVTRTAEGDETVRVRAAGERSDPRSSNLDQGEESQQFTIAAPAGTVVRIQEITRGGWVNVGRYRAQPCDALAASTFREYTAVPGCVVDGVATVEVTRTAAGPEDVRLRANGENSDAIELDQGDSATLSIAAAPGDRIRVQEFKSGRWQNQGFVLAPDCVTGPGEEGQTFEGRASINNPGTDELPLVYSVDVAAEGVAADDAALCVADSLDANAVQGRMVLCDRGVIARTAKSDEVARAGGLAMILGNTTENSVNADPHVIPTVHVDDTANAAIKEYIAATDEPTASQSPAEPVEVPAPDVAAFSSRGPLAATGDLLKPDVLAPGVDVLAAYSPTLGGNEFNYLSGTSMSSPHMAGLSALISGAHPDWSPAAVKSSLMTTAYTERTDGSPIAGGPFAYGSGHAEPNLAWSPGLVYDAGFQDYLAFTCGTGQLPESNCTALGIDPIDPSDLNQPNIAIGELAGSQTVAREVTHVGSEPLTFEVAVDAPTGIDVEVAPSSITLAPGEKAEFLVTFTATDRATLDEAATGSLTWTAGEVEVTSQLVVTPTKLASPEQVSGSGEDGESTYDVGFGYSGEFNAAAHGMVPATRQEGNVVDDPADDINTALDTGVGVTFEQVVVPEGAAHTRIALFDAYTDGADDLDLYVFGPDGAFVGGSGNPTSAEQVDIPFPAAGTYTVAVHGWQTDGPDADYELFDWSVNADPAADDGSLRVDAPDTAVLGETADVTASWAGLEPGTKYLGAVSYADAEALFGLTLVAVGTD